MSQINNPAVGGGGGSGTVTSVGGANGVRATPNPIVGAGIVELDINDLEVETTIAVGDFLPFLDVSSGVDPDDARKITFADLATAVNATAGTITGGACVNLDGVCVFDGQTGTTLNFRGIKSESAALTAVLDAINKTVDLTLDAGLDALAALGAGIAVSDGADGWFARTLVAPAEGLTIGNANGVAGNPTFALANDLAALEGLVGTGYARRTGVDTWVLDAIVPVGNGGTGADLSGTGGASQFVRQSTLGGAFTVSVITSADLPTSVGTCANSLPLLCLAGRAGTANDPLISTSGAQGGSISGSSVSNAPLSLNASTDPTMPGTVLFHKIVANINGFFQHSVAVDLHDLTLTGASPSIVGFGVGTSNYVAHSNWIYSGTTGAVFGFTVSPQLRSDDGGTRTFSDFNGYNFDPELQVGDAGTFTIDDVRIIRSEPVFGRHGATGTLVVSRFTGLEFAGNVGAGAAVTDARAVWVRGLALTGTLNTLTGLAMDDVSATGVISVINSALGAAANKFLLLSAGAAVSAITGGLRIGNTTQPVEKLEVLGNILIDNAGTAGELRLREPSASGVNYTAFKAQAQAANLTYTMPAAITADGFLKTDATGLLTWSVLTSADLPAAVGTCANSLPLMCLAGRAGTANDPTITTTSGGTGNLYGATTTLGRLRLVGNSVDITTGSIDLDTEVRFLPTARASTGVAIVATRHESTLTLSGGANYGAFYEGGTLDFNAGPALGIGPSLVFNNYLLNANATFSIGGLAGFNNAPFVNVATGNTLTLTDTGGALGAFNDSPTYGITGTGAYDAAATHVAFKSRLIITGGTLGLRRGLDFRETTGAGFITTQVGVDIAFLAKGTTNIGIRNASTTVTTPSTAQSITAVGNAILANATTVLVNNTTGGSLTLNSTPTIADGQNGQRVRIISVSATQNVVLQDQGTLAGSNLRLGAVTRVIGPRDSIELEYNTTIGDWVEVGLTNVL